MTGEVALREASSRDREVQEVVLRLVEAYAFSEAVAVLQARLREIAASRQTHLERVFLDWRDLPAGQRPDFLTYAHNRRDAGIGRSADAGGSHGEHG